jgi:hypothetical protein
VAVNEVHERTLAAGPQDCLESLLLQTGVLNSSRICTFIRKPYICTRLAEK